MNAVEPAAPPSEGACDRSGHLSELALDRYRFDPPEAAPALRAEVEAHLASCAECRAVLAALEGEDAGFALVPPAALVTKAEAANTLAPTTEGANVVSLADHSASRRASRRRMGWVAGVSVLLAAAAAVVLVTQQNPVTVAGGPDGFEGPDHITLRGSAIDFEIIVDNGRVSRLVASGDTVHPGERMAFRVKAREDGWLAVVGRDDTNVAYACYPQGADLAAVQAVAIVHATEPKDLPVAMRFDAVIGTERLSAVFCDAPFTGAEAAKLAADGAVIPEHCHVRTLVLHKRAAAAESPGAMGTGDNGAPQ